MRPYNPYRVHKLEETRINIAFASDISTTQFSLGILRTNNIYMVVVNLREKQWKLVLNNLENKKMCLEIVSTIESLKRALGSSNPNSHLPSSLTN